MRQNPAEKKKNPCRSEESDAPAGIFKIHIFLHIY